MDGSLTNLAAALALFVGGHFLLSSAALRQPLLERLGERGFLGAYSLLMLVAFAWVLLAYGRADIQPLYQPPPALRWLQLVLMPLAFFLVVGGVSTRGATTVGGEALASVPGHAPVQGMHTITRHPMLCGVALWAILHLLVRGDAAAVLLFGGMLVLSIGGMQHIDHRRAASLGAAWGPIALTSSALPLAAVLTGRQKLDWRGIGWWRPAVALFLYAAFLHLHRPLFGVSPLPY